MILLLDTSTPTCKLTLADGEKQLHSEWFADRSLANDLLGYIKDRLSEQSKTWNELTGIGVLQGPGSFTGLRIGITVLNAIAEAQKIPIVGVVGDNWQHKALDRLRNNENDKMVLPIYGREANITVRRK